MNKRAGNILTMNATGDPFSMTFLPFEAKRLSRHSNPVTCILFGLDRPLEVHADGRTVTGEMVVIRPGVMHEIEVNGRARVLYFDGLAFPFDAEIAQPVPGWLAAEAERAMCGSRDAMFGLRERLTASGRRCPADIGRIVNLAVADPMQRMAQDELAAYLGMERTAALRYFKAATGMTFRAFKNWIGVQSAALQIAEGELVRSAAMDGGFSDSAHLTRSFRMSFGITPSAATTDRQATPSPARLFNA